MRRRTRAMAIAAAAIGLTFLLATPPSAHAQAATQSVSSTRTPFSDALRSVSWFSWNGIWVRSHGRWAWRPTRRPDWQAYFRCRMGYGSAGYGYGSMTYPLAWMPDPGGYWDLGVGGWMWYPPDRVHYAWDLWYPGPSGYAGFGSYGWGCSYPYAWSSFLSTGMGWWVALVYGYPSYGNYGYGDRYGYGYDSYYRDIALLGRLPPRTIGTRYPHRATDSSNGPGAETDARQPRAFIDPVRTESLDRTLWTGPGTGVWSDPDAGTRVRTDSEGSNSLSHRSFPVTAKEGPRAASSDRELTSARSKPVRAAPDRTPGNPATGNSGASTARPTRSVPSPKVNVPHSATQQPARMVAPSRPAPPARAAQPAKTGGKKGHKE